MKNGLFYTLLFFLFTGKIFSSHIVGGEMYYDRLSDSTYRIKLKVYRDCFNGQAPFDGTNPNGRPAIITVYTGDSLLVDTFDIGAPVITNITPTINNPCITPPSGICVEQGLYTYTITLPPQAKGYYIVYQVTYRNSTIINITTPSQTGSTYYTYIPGPEVAVSNNSPRYANFPSVFICNNVPFTFDHKAIDPDGDQLYYSLCSPFDGGQGLTAPPPPYPTVNYISPYSGSYPISSNPAFSINPTTGLLTGKPNLIGQYVVSVCVQEYKGGVLINTHFRDFQFNVVPCIVQVASDFADQIIKCQGSSITFTNQSYGNLGGLTYAWDFGVPGINSDTSSLFNPTYTYADTGTYQVTLIANPNKPCSDTIQKTVHVYPALNLQLPSSQPQCLIGNSFSFSLQGQYPSYANFNWTFGAAASPSISTVTNPLGIVYSQPGKYLVQVIGSLHACRDTVADSIRVFDRPHAKINNLPSAWCQPATVGFSNGSSSELPLSYSWTFSNGSNSQAFQPQQVFTQAGVYGATLVVTTTSLCADTSLASVVNVTVNPKPLAGFTFSPQVTTIFDPDISIYNTSSADVITWSYKFGDGSTSNYEHNLHTYQEFGDYVINQIVVNQFGCSDTTENTVKILPEFRFWTPNTFTPDNNSVNDKFMPVAIGVSDYKFYIFTRWGEKIYDTQNPKEGWNGYYKGKECEQDIYVWRIEFKNIVSSKDEIHYGHVLLLKNQ